MKKVIIGLTLTVLVATIAIGITHYYSVRILTASRAYTNFESQYSKGEKDASRHLLSYIYSHDEIDYMFFKNDISIPKGDKTAREALESRKDYREARIGFLLAGNNREDLPELIWFFKNFKDVAPFKQAVVTWRQSDAMIDKLDQLGTIVYSSVRSGKDLDKPELVLQINTLSDQLTIKQQSFSSVLGETSRMVDHYAFIIDIVVSIIILTCLALLAGLMLRKLHSSQQLIIDQNLSLKRINERTSTFLYSVTHDLRSPLSSLTGLISVLDREKDITKVPEYTAMMRESILMQDNYIQEVLQAVRTGNDNETGVCNLKQVLDEVIAQNNFFTEGRQVKFLNELEVKEVKCNIAEMKVIFNNLISNAVKYADFSKPEQWIKVRSYQSDKQCIIEVEDNGLGIKPEQKSSVFTKHFKSGSNKKSMGLGLYFARQAIKDLNGTITVRSLFGAGTSFIVSLPLNGL